MSFLLVLSTSSSHALSLFRWLPLPKSNEPLLCFLAVNICPPLVGRSAVAEIVKHPRILQKGHQSATKGSERRVIVCVVLLLLLLLNAHKSHNQSFIHAKHGNYAMVLLMLLVLLLPLMLLQLLCCYSLDSSPCHLLNSLRVCAYPWSRSLHFTNMYIGRSPGCWKWKADKRAAREFLGNLPKCYKESEERENVCAACCNAPIIPPRVGDRKFHLIFHTPRPLEIRLSARNMNHGPNH